MLKVLGVFLISSILFNCSNSDGDDSSLVPETPPGVGNPTPPPVDPGSNPVALVGMECVKEKVKGINKNSNFDEIVDAFLLVGKQCRDVNIETIKEFFESEDN